MYQPWLGGAVQTLSTVPTVDCVLLVNYKFMKGQGLWGRICGSPCLYLTSGSNSVYQCQPTQLIMSALDC